MEHESSVYTLYWPIVYIPRPCMNKGLVTCNRIPYIVPTTENVVTNQFQDNKNTSPVVINFMWIDSMIPEMEITTFECLATN